MTRDARPTRAGFVRQFERRLVQPDLVQLLTLFFVGILFVVGTRWAGIDTQMNDSWYGVAPTRLVGIALLALGYGAAFSERPRAHRVAAVGTLVVAALTTFPLELATFAASHPDIPWWWGLVVPLVDGIAYFGVGITIGRASTWLRLRSILPITVPALLIGATWLDVQLGVGLVNPLTTATVVAPAHLALASATMLCTLYFLFRDEREREEAMST